MYKGLLTFASLTMREFDAVRYLGDEETMAEYLAACVDDTNHDVFLAALGDVAKARGIAQLSKDTGLGRESPYKTFASGKKPHFGTILKITKALGVPLSIKPGTAIPAAKRRRHVTV